jgi:hypothetical protein
MTAGLFRESDQLGVAAGPIAGMRRTLPLAPTFASKKDPNFSRNVLISGENAGKNPPKPDVPSVVSFREMSDFKVLA